MAHTRWALSAYLIATVALPILLLYPALIYYDLAGMGGYDGFASPALMMEHGAWAPAGSAPTVTFRAFEALSCIWALSLANLPIGAVALIGHVARRQARRPGPQRPS